MGPDPLISFPVEFSIYLPLARSARCILSFLLVPCCGCCISVSSAIEVKTESMKRQNRAVDAPVYRHRVSCSMAHESVAILRVERFEKLCSRAIVCFFPLPLPSPRLINFGTLTSWVCNCSLKNEVGFPTSVYNYWTGLPVLAYNRAQFSFGSRLHLQWYSLIPRPPFNTGYETSSDTVCPIPDHVFITHWYTVSKLD